MKRNESGLSFLAHSVYYCMTSPELFLLHKPYP